MKREAQLEMYLYHAAKTPDAAQSRDFVNRYSWSRINVLHVRDEARLMRDSGISAGHITYRITPEEYEGLMKRLYDAAVRNGTIKSMVDIEDLR